MGNVTHFFLGANSGAGFRNLFARFCDSQGHDDLLVLKGGPGCGKSTMMKRIGAAMEAYGEEVEYLHCSGDPDSLDGVYIPRIRTAVVDGTAPHIIEPRYPAAVDRYVDLGRFYHIAMAKEAREEIIRHSNACSEAYRSAYRAFGAARKMEENREDLMIQGLDHEKLRRRTEGIISRELRGKGSGTEERYRFLGSQTWRGAVWRFDSIETLCPRIYHLIDNSGAASVMLDRIHEAARAHRYSAILCPDPEHDERLHHLLIPELGVAFVTCRNGMECPCAAYRRIHVDAMISSGHMKRWKGKLKLMQKMIETLRQEGVSLLREAKEKHDDLEGVYRPYVDFAGVDELTEQEIRRIAGYR